MKSRHGYIFSLQKRRSRPLSPSRCVCSKIQWLRLLQIFFRDLLLGQTGGTRCWRNYRRRLEAFRDIREGLEDEKCLSTFSELHGVVLLNIVDHEFDLWLSQYRCFLSISLPAPSFPMVEIERICQIARETESRRESLRECQSCCRMLRRRRLAVLLLDNDNINGAAQGGRVDGVPRL